MHMQPGSQPEDIHTIMSRFHTWTGKNPGNGSGKSVAPVPGPMREIPYEEAMRNFRQRQKAQTRRASASAASSPAAASSAPPQPLPANPQEAIAAPAQPAETPLPESSPDTTAQSSALVPRPPACVTKALKLPSGKKAAKKQSRPSKSAELQPVVPQALVLAQPRPAQPQPKAALAQPKTVAAQPKAALTQPKAALAQPRAVQPQRNAPAHSKAKSRSASAPKKSTALVLRPLTAEPKKPAFKNVLAKTVRSAPSSAQSTRKMAPAPDRNRRITTRFSAAEQRRLEQAATQAGLSVSAWLRQCALRTEIASGAPPATAAPAKAENRSRRRTASTLFSTPAPSGVGSWLTLLRQRFLSSPARFSERA
jgi:Mobilization protein NikA